jgi:hypothetical protein
MADIFTLQAAVIRAAWRFAEYPDDSSLKVGLIQAVAAHKEAAINYGAKLHDPRVAEFVRRVRESDRPHAVKAANIIERRAPWGMRGLTLEEMACFDWRDVKYAGPEVWILWARVLDSMGVEPIWARSHGVKWD